MEAQGQMEKLLAGEDGEDAYGGKATNEAAGVLGGIITKDE